MPMPNRQIVGGEPYRYAYQGQEKDPETGKEAFQLRLWDSRIGRWLSPDPAKQYYSPYLGMGNNPILMIDPDGGFACPDGDCETADGGTLDEVVIKAKVTPHHTSEVDPYTPVYTLAEYRKTFNVPDDIPDNEVYAWWQKNHGKNYSGPGQDFESWVAKMEQRQKDEENLAKLRLFTAYFYAIEDVVEVMPMNMAANVTTKIVSKSARVFNYSSVVPETTLYRAVDDIELAILKERKAFTLQARGTESKYFAKSIDDAHWYGTRLYPDGYTIVKGVYKGNISNHWYPNVDIGAYNFVDKYLPFIKYKP